MFEPLNPSQFWQFYTELTKFKSKKRTKSDSQKMTISNLEFEFKIIFLQCVF